MLPLLPNPAARGIFGNPGADGCGRIMEKEEISRQRPATRVL